MHTRNRWRIWSAGFALAFVLAGCGPKEVPKAPGGAAPAAPSAAGTPAAPRASAPAAVEPAAAVAKDKNKDKDKVAEQPQPASPASPAPLEEATRVLDLRKLPLPDDGKDLYTSASVPKGDPSKDLNKSARALTCFLRRPDGAQVAQFFRSKLSEAGWKISEAAPSQDFHEFTGIKQGFFLSGSVYENRAAGELGVSIMHHGNIDSRTLPRAAGAELKENDVSRTIYLTDAKPDAVLEFMRTELKKSGWREVRMQGGVIDNEPGFPVLLRFIQRGIEIGLSVQGKNGKTEVWNKVCLLDVELPVMPEASGVVEFLGYAHYVHLLYALPATGPEKVLDFYRKEMPALGWTMRAGTDKIEGGKARVILEAPGRNSMRLELLAEKQGTFVLIAAEQPGEGR